MEYRLYRLDTSGHIDRVAEISATGDDDAFTKTQLALTLNGWAVWELWQGARKLTTSRPVWLKNPLAVAQSSTERAAELADGPPACAWVSDHHGCEIRPQTG